MIPKILHFCFGLTPDFGGKPWSLVHYVCVKSAIERIKPEAAFLSYEFESEGPWWDLTKDIVETQQIMAPREIFGNHLLHPAHRSGAVRLERLLTDGGIYLDCDVLVHRDFDPLLRESVVLGQQGEGGRIGLCDAVILAEPNASFIRRWYQSYRTFRSKGKDAYWDEHAVRVPADLARSFPDELTIVPETAFFWPTCDEAGLQMIFRSTQATMGGGVYANHLWEMPAWFRFLEDLTPARVRRVDSNFHRWIRPLVADLPADFGRPPTIARTLRSARRAARPAVVVVRRTRAAVRRIVSAKALTAVKRRPT